MEKVWHIQASIKSTLAWGPLLLALFKSPFIPLFFFFFNIFMYLFMPVEPQDETYSPSVAPPPQTEPEPVHTEASPIKDQRVLLLSAKYDNILNHVEAAYDNRVLALYKKSKVFKKNLPYIGKVSGTADYRPASKTTQSSSATPQTKTVAMSLKGGLYGLASYRPSQFIFDAKSLGVSLSSDLDKGHMTMTEWRKNLYKLISLHGFQSPWTIRLLTREHAQKPSNDTQLVAAIPSLQPELAATHQRVVQKIEMKDTLEVTTCGFYHIVPKASLHSFVTTHLCGKTHYGQLEFNWIRGCDEETCHHSTPSRASTK